MDTLIVLHTGHALDLLRVLLGLLGDQLLQMLHLVLQVYGLSLTHLELLGLEVVNVAPGDGKLVLSVLQSGAGVIEVIGPEVTTTISPHQLIIQ
jgi:hypothetical protein